MGNSKGKYESSLKKNHLVTSLHLVTTKFALKQMRQSIQEGTK